MFGLFKRLLGKRPTSPAYFPTPAESAPSEPTSPADEVQPAPEEPSRPIVQNLGSPQKIETLAQEECVPIPLKNLVARLPASMRTQILRPPKEDDHARLPLRAIQEQMARGAVRVSFADLRGASPPGIFAASQGADAVAITLPLDLLLRC